jgi:hypothetical protein
MADDLNVDFMLSLSGECKYQFGLSPILAPRFTAQVRAAETPI